MEPLEPHLDPPLIAVSTVIAVSTITTVSTVTATSNVTAASLPEIADVHSLLYALLEFLCFPPILIAF